MGGRAAVANNNQIENGISSAIENVISGVLELYLQELVQYNRITANKDTGITQKEIHNAVRAEDRKFAKVNGHGAFVY